MSYQTLNPATGELLETFVEATDDQLEAKLTAAAACFAVWRHQSYAERARVVSRVAALMLAQREHLARTMTIDMGKRIADARGEVAFSSAILTYYAENAERFLAPVALHPATGEAYLESSPLGVIFAIEPWNFPYYQLARVAGPQLMAGNVLVVKHAGNVPRCATAFEALWAQAGGPTGLYTNLRISYDQANTIIDDPRVKGVALTGSAAAGAKVAARAGRNLKPSSLELGGSDAFIVLEDADLDHALHWAVWGRMYNDGQACVAAKRFIVVEAVADVFLDRFRAALIQLTPGDPLDETTTLGPLSTEAALVHLLEQVEDAVAHGAKVVLGGERIPGAGSFMEPTILTDVTPDNPAYREEFFGPVALFFRVEDEDAAIALANDSDYGLGGAVFTRDLARGKRVASRIETGMMFVNNLDWADAELPFGGIKTSGYGRELGELGIQQFVNKKLVRTSSAEAPERTVAPPKTAETGTGAPA